MILPTMGCWPTCIVTPSRFVLPRSSPPSSLCLSSFPTLCFHSKSNCVESRMESWLGLPGVISEAGPWCPQDSLLTWGSTQKPCGRRQRFILITSAYEAPVMCKRGAGRCPEETKFYVKYSQRKEKVFPS